MEYILEEMQHFAVFTMDATQRRWWQRFLQKPFYHVMIVHTWVDAGRHFVQVEDPVVDFGKWSVQPRESEPFQVTHWYSYLKKYRDLCIANSGGLAPKAVKLKIKLDKYNTLHKLLSKIPLCTTYVSRRFGIASYAITPLQLYHSLRNKGYGNLF